MELSARFINVPGDQVDALIQDAQRCVCECLRLDVSALWQWEADNPNTFVLTHHYRPLGGPPVPERMNASEHFPWSLREMMGGRSVLLSSFDDIPEGAERDLTAWRHFGIKNGATFPLSAGGGVTFGAVSFHDMVVARTWSESVVKRLQLVAQIFANAISRKRSDEALRESELRLALAADSAGVGLWSFDLTTTRYWLTPKARELIGADLGEIVTWARFIDLVHADDRARVARELQEVVQSGNEGRVEFRVVSRDGNLRWLISRGRLQSSAPAAPRCVMGVTMDITEHKRAEKALSESMERFRQVAEIAEEFIWEVDENGLYTYASPSVGRILGYTPDELVGKKHFHDLFEPSACEELKAAVFGVFADRKRFRDFPNLNVHKSGTIVHLETSGIPMLDAAGKLDGYRGAATDVTARKRAEAEAQSSRQELALVSRISTLGELAASLAHELSQPLGAILRNAEVAELMLQTPVPDLEELRAIVTDIRKDDQRAGQVIDRLRSLLKRRSLNLQPVEINGVIMEVLSLVQADAAARRVKLVFSSTPGLPSVQGDRVHLQQVLLNLLVNALDALAGAASDHPSVQITALRKDAGRVEVHVCDNGPGVAAGSIERVFEPFFTTKANGMGMGLSVSRTIIQAHSGAIWVESRPGSGASFCFTLPAGTAVCDEGGRPITLHLS